MPLNSKQKGKRGELELAQFLRERGFDEARRGVQYSGGPDSPDVVGLDGFAIECKRVEAGNLYSWLDQARSDAADGRVPLVAHRRNRQPWVAILTLDDFLTLYRRAHGLATD